MPKLQTHSFRAMNCAMSAVVYATAPAATAALHAVEAWMRRVEMTLSRFRPDSELSQLNAHAGQPFSAGPILWEVTQAALAAAASSEGVFDPTIARALLAAGYDRSFEKLAACPPGAPSSPPLHPPAATWQDIHLDSSQHTITLPRGVQLDLGGIAKGWAADRALAMLAPFGPACVDAGGDLAVGAAPPESEGWPVGIADPLLPEQDIALLHVAHVGVATSGTDFRRWRQGHRMQHHIIDPQRQHPAQTDILCSTVVAASATAADVAALVLTVLNSEGANTWLATHPHAALLVLADGQNLQTPLFEPYVDAYYPHYQTTLV